MAAIRKSISSELVTIKSSTPWINREIHKDIAKRELFYRRYKKSNSQDWFSKFKTLRNKIVTNICDAKKHFFIWLITCRNDPKKFWSIIKSVKPRTHLPGQVTVPSDTDKADLLNEFFISCFNPAIQSPSYSEFPQCADSDAAVYDITQDKVYMHLRMIKLHSAAGPDEITSWMLSIFVDAISPSLAPLYNLSISTGQILADWKLSNVLPIPKEPTKYNVRFFRPISLLLVVSKVLERHLHQLLMDLLLSRNALSDMQFGFRKYRSTIIPLLIAMHQWHLSPEKHHRVACFFFDFAKAFELCLTRRFSTSYINWTSYQFCFGGYPIICQTISSRWF